MLYACIITLLLYILCYVLVQVPDNLTVNDLGAGRGSNTLPVVLTPAVQQCLDVFRPWLRSESMQPFLLLGPEGCGKELLLRYSFAQLRSAQLAIIHCSAQTSAAHVIQKLTQVCMVFSTNMGRVYRPRDSERLIVYLKDINLPKPDKWGTSQLIAFLQQASHSHLCIHLHCPLSRSYLCKEFSFRLGICDLNKTCFSFISRW